MHLFRKLQIFLVLKLRPELCGQDDSIDWKRSACKEAFPFRLVLAEDGVVDPLGVADVLKHDLALLQ